MGSALFWFDGAKGGEEQLDYGVVLQLGHSDQFGCCSHYDPEGGVAEDSFEVHGYEPVYFNASYRVIQAELSDDRDYSTGCKFLCGHYCAN